jgi:hypothetical protein
MEETIKNLDKYLGNIAIEVIKIGKEIKELKDQYKNKYKDTFDKNQNKEKSIDRIICYQCNNKGHYSTRCKTVKRKSRICENCGGQGHFTKECISDEIKEDRMKCYRCNEMGHYAKDCPAKIKIVKRENNKCKKCGEKGHYTKECLDNLSKENNNGKTIINNDDKNGNPDRKDTKGKKLYIGDDYVTIKNKNYNGNVKDQIQKILSIQNKWI